MPQLNVKSAQQKTANSCWACCTRLVLNYYKGQDVYLDDITLATTVNLNPNVVQDVSVSLKAAGILFGQDGAGNIPTRAEIIKEIDAGRPIVVCVSAQQVAVGGNVVGGHYVVITGYDGNAAKCMIEVMDPAHNKKDWMAYDGTFMMSPNYLKTPIYWGITYYTTGTKVK